MYNVIYTALPVVALAILDQVQQLMCVCHCVCTIIVINQHVRVLFRGRGRLPLLNLAYMYIGSA